MYGRYPGDVVQMSLEGQQAGRALVPLRTPGLWCLSQLGGQVDDFLAVLMSTISALLSALSHLKLGSVKARLVPLLYCGLTPSRAEPSPWTPEIAPALGTGSAAPHLWGTLDSMIFTSTVRNQI